MQWPRHSSPAPASRRRKPLSRRRAIPSGSVVADDLERSRLTVFFRLLLAIPHLFVLLLWSTVAFVIAVINWFATLAKGQSPEGLHDFLANYLRYATQVEAYLLLAANPFPPFFVGRRMTGYPIDLEVAAPAAQSRWQTLFRLFLALPAVLLAAVFLGGPIAWIGIEGGGVAGVAAVLLCSRSSPAAELHAGCETSQRGASATAPRSAPISSCRLTDTPTPARKRISAASRRPRFPSACRSWSTTTTTGALA